MFRKFSLFKKQRTKKKQKSFRKNKIYKTLLLSLKILGRNEITKEACSLSYYGLLSCIPILVFFLRLSRHLFINTGWQEWLIIKFPEYKEPIQAIIEVAKDSHQESNIGLVLVGSFFVFCWSGILMLLSLEDGLNKIFRTGWTPISPRRLISYLIITLVSPMIFIIICGSWVYITQIIPIQYSRFFNFSHSMTTIYLLSRMTSYLLLYFILFCLYSFLPRATVQKSSALISSLIVGSIWVVFQKAFFCLQAHLFNYSFTYGALVALPSILLLFYSYATIYLFGGALTFAIQNRSCSFTLPRNKPLPDCYVKLVTTTYILAFMTKCFNTALPSPTAKSIAQRSNIPIGEITQSLNILESENLVFSHNKKYQPTYNLAELTIKDIIQKLIHSESIPSTDKTINLIQTKLAKILQETSNSKNNLTLMEIAKHLR
ncbi:YihY/virulence factor BrkB family protein [Chlamydia sp. 17-3921]|uniref:YihY/virulence factor BrkB family protein n=1 Tax=Chlamydia sp. 17-3921 TaxID=2675798 RepID=UPI0019190250|nr:YihY/virulence factor BrkB family protein [Chlamydia sp. 17-3921]